MALREWTMLILLRLIFVALLISGLGGLLVWWPYHQAKTIVISEIQRREANQAERNRMIEAFTQTPSLQSVPLRVRGEMKSHLLALEKSSSEINITQLVPPSTIRPVLSTPLPALRGLVIAVNEIVQDPDFGQRYYRAAAVLERAERLLAYRIAIVTALTNVWEYDAAQDFASYDRSSPDTQERLRLAKEGLARTKSQLEAARSLYDDPSLEQVITAVDTFERERMLLEDQGDLPRWIRETSSLQAKIQENRIKFWEKEYPTILKEMGEVERELSAVLDRWKSLRDTFDLSANTINWPRRSLAQSLQKTSSHVA